MYKFVGVEISESPSITRVRVFPRNDDNHVNPGELYELLYADKEGWVSCGIKEAEDDTITFDEVPSNALYWIRNHTKGDEERVFTYDSEGIQVW